MLGHGFRDGCSPSDAFPDPLKGLVEGRLSRSFSQEVKAAEHRKTRFDQGEKFLIENQEFPQGQPACTGQGELREGPRAGSAQIKDKESLPF